ncbi:hypothetical protein LX32DRAFT_644411 [Colletotrichum zoysiae]|uniref:Uncharacterized protein n=1 Tax=Colletotrichum zoysiae TaxID=1216348 RepID=A0AAD9LWD4_9PEZI|nr:hypothetical protein LX32DRAFT_644411 [Colletotrichum zoysiae]
MSERAPSLKRCPKSHCTFRSDSNAAVHDHIIDVHDEDPEQMACGSYIIKTKHYNEKHKKECDQCKPGASTAQTVVPSIESDADSDNSSGTGTSRDSEAKQAVRNLKLVIHGNNYGVINLMPNKCSAWPRCSGGSN